MISLAEMCYQARKAMKLSQKDMAKLIGCQQSEIHYIEGGYIPEENAKRELIKALWNRWCSYVR
jgi:transcriptional regulator with XRE-family HTH domain